MGHELIPFLCPTPVLSPDTCPNHVEQGSPPKGGAPIPKKMHERVQELYQLKYDCCNWIWLLDPRRPSKPPNVPRPSASGRDDEMQVPTTGKESAFLSDISVREAKSRSKSRSPEPEVRLKKRSARAERQKSRELQEESSPQPLIPGG